MNYKFDSYIHPLYVPFNNSDATLLGIKGCSPFEGIGGGGLLPSLVILQKLIIETFDVLLLPRLLLLRCGHLLLG